MQKLSTVRDYINALRKFPADMPVHVSTLAGGGIAIEQRDVRGTPTIAVFGRNGGRFGENPLTEEEYTDQSRRFLDLKKKGYLYTPTHGDHRLYLHGGTSDGIHFDRRIIERMVAEGVIQNDEVDIDRVRRCSA